MTKSISEWLAEGETLYTAAVGEYRELETRLAALEEQMAAKLSEVNKLATVIQKPVLETRSKSGVTIIDRPAPERAPAPTDRSSSSIRASARPGGGMVDVTPAAAFPAGARNIAAAIQGKGI